MVPQVEVLHGGELFKLPLPTSFTMCPLCLSPDLAVRLGVETREFRVRCLACGHELEYLALSPSSLRSA